ncbi:unnamed protein product [Mytilus edulis]|uniref:Uncharacterized protein n=1 Tax=Mytilus edulis TaxID=6550 RepID=A0A8S3RPL1_MYTED|nr:unnamed protein product [Mytilus edulis]
MTYSKTQTDRQQVVDQDNDLSSSVSTRDISETGVTSGVPLRRQPTESSNEDHVLLQKDLDTPVQCSKTWQMEFNVKKCDFNDHAVHNINKEETVPKTVIKQLEQVHRNAARFITNQPNNQEKPICVTSIVQNLNWNTMGQRRTMAHFAIMYKVVHQLIAVPILYISIPATVNRTRNSNSLIFLPYHCRINIYQHSFSPRTVTVWNTLSESVELALSLEAFKSSKEHQPKRTNIK